MSNPASPPPVEFMSEDSVRDVLRPAKVNEWIEVKWMDEATLRTWRGQLKKFSRGRWSVSYDMEDEVIDTIIPNPEVNYVGVSLSGPVNNPTTVTQESRMPTRSKHTSTTLAAVTQKSSKPTCTIQAAVTQESSKPTSTALAVVTQKSSKPTSTPQAAVTQKSSKSTSTPQAAVTQESSKPNAKALTTPSSSASPASQENEVQNFRWDPSIVPEVILTPGHQIKGRYLVELLTRAPPKSIPPSTGAALKKETMTQHLRYLERIAEVMDPSLSLSEALIDGIDKLATKHQWKKSTILKTQASVQGALKVLPLYKEGAPSIRVPDPIWSLSMRTRGMEAKEEKPTQPRPATSQEVYAAVEKTKDDAVAVALLLGWLTASRLGCILQLKKEDIATTKDSLSITFRRGKGVRASGPYTVHTAPLPPQFRSRWEKYLASRSTALFPRRLTGASLKMALREVSPELEQRSIRRGALQLMASNNTDEETLMRFSGHRRVETLRRYPNWNTVDSRLIHSQPR